jgi:glucose/arabinose dehydrogenase
VPRIACIAALAILLCAAPSTSAVTLEPVGSFDRPIFVASDPADPERLFVVERDGVVVEVDGETSSPYADITDLVACCAGERGLLSIALAPDFPSSGRFYAFYTGEPIAGGQEGDIHVDSFRPAPGGGAPIREPILEIDHSTEDNHNGGQLQFGPDGFLYISTGDGGGGGDPFDNGQDVDSLLGKVLRIDPRPGQTPAYVVPSGNPFLGGPGLDEIWAYGLRNPWRFSFDRRTGDLSIGDVGQEEVEEIDFVRRGRGSGANFGWRVFEGNKRYAPGESARGAVRPVITRLHKDGWCSITGGVVVRDPRLPGLAGRYVFGDICQSRIWSARLSPGRARDVHKTRLAVPSVSSFGEDARGRVYVTSIDGPVYRLAPR